MSENPPAFPSGEYEEPSSFDAGNIAQWVEQLRLQMLFLDRILLQEFRRPERTREIRQGQISRRPRFASKASMYYQQVKESRYTRRPECTTTIARLTGADRTIQIFWSTFRMTSPRNSASAVSLRIPPPPPPL